ncbi:hypothetical protein RSAG8_03083, partial [Rhizoctonia solani AG-8 WAC10335]
MGIQTFDTANVYSNGLSKVILGKVYFKVGHRVDEIMLRGGGYPNEHGLSRKHIFDSIKHSLEEPCAPRVIFGHS